MRVYIAASANHVRHADMMAALRLAGHDCFTRPYVDDLRQADAVVFMHPADEMAMFEYGAAIGSGRGIFVVLESEHDRLRFPLPSRIKRTCLIVDEVIQALDSDPMDVVVDHTPEEES